MKKIILILLCVIVSASLKAQNITGAWQGFHTNENGETVKSVLIVSEGFLVETNYNAITGKFISTTGGSFKISDITMTEKVEFDTANPERVGLEVESVVLMKGEVMQLIGNAVVFERIDNGTPGKLQGAWLMSGRMTDGKAQMRDTSGPRKTMKLLSGTRFQWIAYNTDTKEFMGTGGGTYVTEGGEYTESIEFFSKDDSKVGVDLPFKYQLIDGIWHHTGLSSKGDPMHELWSARE